MWLDDVLGVSARLQADRRLRALAGRAGEGEVWACRLAGRDRRGNRAVSWVVGPVTAPVDGPGGRGKRLGGQEMTDPGALSRAGGVLRPRFASVLSRGEWGAPPRPPFAGGEQFEQVPTGTRVVVEHARPDQPGTRFLEAGVCGYVQVLRNGQAGRCVGNVWVALDDVVGLVPVTTDHYESFEVGADDQQRADQPQAGAQTDGVRADGGPLRQQGARPRSTYQLPGARISAGPGTDLSGVSALEASNGMRAHLSGHDSRWDG